MADKSKVGTRYVFEWPVERGKIWEMARAVGDENPLYRDAEAARAAGYDDVIAPLIFTTVPLMWTGTVQRAFTDLGMVHGRIMHAEQSYEYFREIHPGDVLTGVVEVKSVVRREGSSGRLDFVLFEVSYSNQRGEPVQREEMLVVERL